ncbi:MAG: hypothetical protein O2798_04470 [Chloroflexi bacterium]|nr:hypothetical protein [Chloroflexota bacterium]
MLLIGQSLTLHRGPLVEAVQARDPAPLVERARRQIDAGAEALDVNIGVNIGRANGDGGLIWAVQALREHGINLPLWLDCADTEVVASALRQCRDGSPLVANGLPIGDREHDGEQALLEAVAEGGHGLVVSPRLTHSNAPPARVRAISKAVERARAASVTGPCYADALAWPPATDPRACSRSLELLALIASELPGVEPVAAVGNVSHGLPPQVARFARALYAGQAVRSGARALMLPVEDPGCVAAARTGVARAPGGGASRAERDDWEAAGRLINSPS